MENSFNFGEAVALKRGKEGKKKKNISKAHRLANTDLLMLLLLLCVAQMPSYPKPGGCTDKKKK